MKNYVSTNFKSYTVTQFERCTFLDTVKILCPETL